MFTRNSPPEPSKLSARLNGLAIAPVPHNIEPVPPTVATSRSSATIFGLSGRGD